MVEIKRPNHTNHTILVVEDDPNLRRLFVEILRRDSHIVLEADSGEAAMSKIEAFELDVVISDMQMQKLSGLDVLKAATRKDPNTQVIIITGFASVGTAVRAMREGAYEYLTKPVQPDALTIKVRNAIERRRLLITLAEQEKTLQMHHEMIDRDLILARQIQASLVPSNFTTDGIDIGIRYRPMIGLGGDFADFYRIDEERLYLVVIDVTGHGIAAALLVSRVCHEWRRAVQQAPGPGELLWQLNEFFIETFFDTPLFLTIMAVEVNLRQRRLRYAGSAHPAALLQRNGQGFVRLDSQNAIIGFAQADKSTFHSASLTYKPGDNLLIYTDGLVEAETIGGKILGLQGLQRIIRQEARGSTALKTAEAIVDRVVEFTRAEPGDDMLMTVAHLF